MKYLKRTENNIDTYYNFDESQVDEEILICGTIRFGESEPYDYHPYLFPIKASEINNMYHIVNEQDVPLDWIEKLTSKTTILEN